MGVGLTHTHTIFFIASVMLAATVVGIFNNSVGSFTGQVQDRSNHLSEELATDIRIINDPANMPNNPVTFYVLNTGSAAVFPTETVVMINGQAYTTLNTDVLDSSEEILRTGQVMSVEVTGQNLANGDYHGRVIVNNGVADNLRFSIGLV